ncbi:hypothetical protein PPERSA_12758 [Pseudocohnilembus persalinus]|uniref:Uncharacterized protein n=1 Tax=Pseudocohnilembus persalinus TaxID=266149 RepID=A0A0V0QTC4_PSEPJ|nr:hypothetical protein PPERSA_12758 [Pseudocohnilembus persalinus]|eukprot:KRX05580.1 hypothetical protein PPERSA_12758 [Pseudocohnilembus persalinus]
MQMQEKELKQSFIKNKIHMNHLIDISIQENQEKKEQYLRKQLKKENSCVQMGEHNFNNKIVKEPKFSEQYLDPFLFNNFPILYCKEHKQFQLNMVCANKNCEKKGLICCRCLTEEHLLNHEINSILCLDDVLSMCYNKLDLENEENEQYQFLIQTQQQMIKNLRDFAKQASQIADDLEQDIKFSAFNTRVEAQLKQEEVRDIALQLKRFNNIQQNKSESIINWSKNKKDNNKNQNNQNCQHFGENQQQFVIRNSFDQMLFEQNMQKLSQKIVFEKIKKKQKKNEILLDQNDQSLLDEQNNYKSENIQEEIQQEEDQIVKKIVLSKLDQYVGQQKQILHNRSLFLKKKTDSLLKNMRDIKFLTDQKKEWQCKIYQNMDLKEMVNQGWIIHYNFDYAKVSKVQDFLQIEKNCFDDSLICVGAINKEENENKIQLGAIDKKSEVFQLSQSCKKARKSENGDIYWYFVEKKSFGFADNEQIQLKDGDFNTFGKRISWKLNGEGGYRAGDNINLYNSSNWKKIILVLK